jgi:ribosomal protein L19E
VIYLVIVSPLCFKKKLTTNFPCFFIQSFKGMERQRALEAHHRKLLNALRAEHKTQFVAKQREHRKGLRELNDDQKDELEYLKNEQMSDMDGMQHKSVFFETFHKTKLATHHLLFTS